MPSSMPSSIPSPMSTSTASVADYLATLPAGRRGLVDAIRAVVLDNLDGGYEEVLQYRMVSWCVPHALFPPGYHCDPRQPLPFAALASQKHHVSLYLMGLYCGGGASGKTDESAWFRAAWARSGKHALDMGKACIRFKTLDEVALDVIGEAIRRMPAQRYIERYEASRAAASRT